MTVSRRLTRIERCGAGDPELEWFMPDPEPWMHRGLCAQTDPEAFFPEKGESTRPGKAICQRCEVRSECLAYALEHNERYGVWGGLSERERRKLKPKAPSLPPDYYEQRAEIIHRMAGEGWTVAQIADELGIGRDAVHKALKKQLLVDWETAA